VENRTLQKLIASKKDGKILLNSIKLILKEKQSKDINISKELIKKSKTNYQYLPSCFN
jgi:hypothetical protein